MRLTVDSNVLVYSFVTGDPEKHRLASDLMIRAMLADVVLTAQALAEFLNVIRRKDTTYFEVALAQAKRWATVFPLIETSGNHVLEAADMALRHKLQLWDCVIWKAARSAHAVIFLSEDMQDGLNLDGMTVLNPFTPANRSRLDDLLVEESGSR